MSIARRIGVNMAAAFIGKVLVAVAGLMTVAVMTRHLGASNYGILRTAQTFVLFAGTLAHFGLQLIMARDVAVHESRAAQIVGAALGMRMFIAILMLAAGVVIASFLPWSTSVVLAILLAAVGMAAYQSNEVVTAVLQWRLSQGRAMAAEVIGTFVTLLGAAVVAYAGFGVLAMTAVSSLGLVVTFLLAWSFANRLTPVRPRIDLEEWRRLGRAGLPIALSSYLTLISLRGDTLLLSFLKPVTDVGLYGVASKIYEVGLQLPVIFGGLLMPLFARVATDAIKLHEQLTHALHALVVVGIAIALTLVFFAREIVWLLAGPGFVAASTAVQLTGISVALAGYSTVMRYAAIAQERQRQLLIADVIITAGALCAYLVFIPRWSYVGAALGTLAAEVIAIACVTVIVGRGLKALPWSNLNLRAMLAGAASALLMLWLQQNDAALIVRVLACAGSYSVLLLVSGAISPSMLRTVLLPVRS